MTDISSHYSDDELNEAMQDVKDLLEDFKHQQQQLDDERYVIIDQVQATLAQHEKLTSDYEEKRDKLDLRQDDLTKNRQTFEKTLSELQMQVDAKQEAKQARKSTGKGSGKTPPPINQGTAAASGIPPQIVTKDQIKKLKSQLSKPKLELTYSPPGGIGDASTLNKDLKKMAQIHEKQGRLTEASIRMRTEYNDKKGKSR